MKSVRTVSTARSTRLQSCVLHITCDGSDEKECLDRTIEIVKNGLGESLAL